MTKNIFLLFHHYQQQEPSQSSFSFHLWQILLSNPACNSLICLIRRDIKDYVCD